MFFPRVSMSLGVYLKWLKSVPIDTFLLIETYFSVYLRPERSPAARRCACLTNFYDSGCKLKLNADILRTKYFAHHFGGYDVINECTLFMHLVKLTKFTLGPIARKVIIGYTQPWYQIKSHKFLLLLSYDT